MFPTGFSHLLHEAAPWPDTEFAPLSVGMLLALGFCILGLALEMRKQRAVPRTLEVVRKRFFCPTQGQEVEADFLTDPEKPEGLLEVVRCSAFAEGEAACCDRSCTLLPQARTAPPLFRSPLPMLH